MNRSKTIILIIIALIISIFLFIAFNKSSNELTENSQMPVSICSIETESYEPTIETFGTITFNSKHDITSLQSGRIVNKNVKEGEYVRKGQLLYVLQNQELEIQKAKYLNDLNTYKANIELYEAKLVEHRQNVKKTILNNENIRLELQLLNEKISRENERLTLNLQINQMGGISDQSIKDMKEEISVLEMNRLMLEQELIVSQSGYTREDLIKEGITPSEVDDEFTEQIIELNSRTCIADLNVAKSEYENSKKNLELIEKLLRDLNIESPVSGIVGATYFETGEYITSNERLLTIMDIDTCIGSIPLQESQIKSIHSGMDATISIPSMDLEFKSTISDISPFTDSNSGNFYVKIPIPNKNSVIKPGMFIKCSIPTSNSKTYYKLPESALLTTNNNYGTFFSINNDIAIQKSLQIDFIKDGYAYIHSGLTSKEKIINHPSKQLKDGLHVKVL